MNKNLLILLAGALLLCGGLLLTLGGKPELPVPSSEPAPGTSQPAEDRASSPQQNARSGPGRADAPGAEDGRPADASAPGDEPAFDGRGVDWDVGAFWEEQNKRLAEAQGARAELPEALKPWGNAAAAGNWLDPDSESMSLSGEATAARLAELLAGPAKVAELPEERIDELNNVAEGCARSVQELQGRLDAGELEEEAFEQELAYLGAKCNQSLGLLLGSDGMDALYEQAGSVPPEGGFPDNRPASDD